jgi:hypothetical protein
MATKGFAVEGHVAGLRQAKAAFQALPEITRDAMAAATFTTVSEIARIAKQRLLANGSIQTRTLYNALGFTMNMKNGRGRAGIQNVTTRISNDSASKRTFKVKGRIVSTVSRSGAVTQRVVRPSKYGHLVEFGARGGQMRAAPFMLPAAENQKAPYLDRCRQAGKAIERHAANIGMRNL